MLPPCGTRVLCRREKTLGTVGKLPADLADMAGIVEADAEDLVGVGNDRIELDLVEREVAPGALGGGGQLAGSALAAMASRRLGQRDDSPCRQIDDAAVDDRAEFGCARMAKTDQPHGCDPMPTLA